MYELGKFTRERYRNFLPKHYSKKDFQIYATEIERTNVSAQLFAAGLYSPTKQEIWNNELHWNPVPVFTADENIFNVTPIRVCPLYRKLYTEVLNQRLEEFKKDPISDYIAKKSGLEINYLTILLLHDTFKTESSLGVSLPEWAKRVYPEAIDKYAVTHFVATVQTEQMKRLRKSN